MSARLAGLRDGATNPNVIHATLADMDYSACPSAEAAFADVAAARWFGYAVDRSDLVRQALVDWGARRFDWELKASELITAPFGAKVLLGYAVRSAAARRWAVLTPCYSGALKLLKNVALECVEIPTSAQYDATYDAEYVGDALASCRPEAILLCNPANPGGISIPAEGIRGILDYAESAKAAVVSDEVHAPLIYPKRTFSPMGRAAIQRTVPWISIGSIGKAYNVSGLASSFCAGSRPWLAKLANVIQADGWYQTSLLADTLVLATVAPEQDEWLDARIALVAEGMNRFRNAVADSAVSVTEADAGFLAWIDLRKTGMFTRLGDRDAAGFLLRHAGVETLDGSKFGAGGRGFVRVNTAIGENYMDEMAARLRRVTTE